MLLLEKHSDMCFVGALGMLLLSASFLGLFLTVLAGALLF